MDLTRPLALLVLAGGVLLPASPAAAACTGDVTVKFSGYAPNPFTVDAGETVTWCWVENNHSVTGSFGDSQVRNLDATFSRVFNTAGTFAYHCSVHGSMQGTIVVSGSASPSPTASKTSAAPKPTTTSPTPRRTTAPPTVAPTTRTATPTTAAPTTSPPTTVAPTTAAPTTAAAVTTSPAALDIDPDIAKPKTGLAVVLGLLLAGAAFGGLGWLLLKGRSG